MKISTRMIGLKRRYFLVRSREDLQRKIERKQREDPVARDALNQIQNEGDVSKGQLKRVGERLSIRNGILLFLDRIIVPQRLRLEVLEAVHSQHHLGVTELYNHFGIRISGLNWLGIHGHIVVDVSFVNAVSTRTRVRS